MVSGVTVTLSETVRHISALIDREREIDWEMAELGRRLLILQSSKEGIVAAYKRLAQEVSK